MSIRSRATAGAIALFGGLLLALAGSVTKSDHRLQYERDLGRHEKEPERYPDAPPASGTAGTTAVILVGLALAAGGAVPIVSALRSMTQEIGQAQSRAEAAMREAVLQKRDPDPKP